MLGRCLNKLLLGTSTLLLAGNLHAKQPSDIDLGLADQLNRPLTATWQGQELGLVLERIATSQGLDVWLDRRVDLQQPIEVRVNNAPLADVLDKITAPRELGWSTLGGIIYIGPRNSASELATLAQLAKVSLSLVPAKARQRWLAAEPTEWPRLSEPRQILNAWLQKADIQVDNPDALPHDLWNARSLRPLSLADRTVLLLTGYDLTCEISSDGQSFRIVSITRPVVTTKSYQAGRRTRQLMAEFKLNPNVSINRKEDRIAITGRWEDHERVAAILNSVPSENETHRPRTKLAHEKVFSLRLTNQPVGKVIDQLAAQLGLNVSWNQELLERQTDPRTTLVTCDVSNVNLPRLLSSIFASAGFDFVLEGNALKIMPKN